ncbi:MAG: transglycosylase SLT domain-containing protein [Alistipes sp.]|nr:transglycosylase SLT domain-containing protein [Alistipes sp.]
MKRGVVNNVIVPTLFLLIAGSSATMSVQEIDKRTVKPIVIEEPKEVIPLPPPPPLVISKYDALFKEVAEKYNMDWRFLAAVANAESRFTNNAVSPAGAVGLMQIMPIAAKQFGYTRAQLHDPRINIEIAVKVLNKNQELLKLPDSIDEDEELKLILACYNAGFARVVDARALTRHFNGNACCWEEVANYLSKLSQSEFARHKVVKYGRFRGSKETIGFVNKVMTKYNQYKNGKTE